MVAGKYWLLSGAVAVAFIGGCMGLSTTPETDTCSLYSTPVVSLNYGSRYEAGSRARDDLDEDSNAEVNAALGPVDDFIRSLAKATDDALALNNGASRAKELSCVGKAIHQWAAADALSDLGSVNARMSSPSRIAGIATIYNRLPASAKQDGQQVRTVQMWLARRGDEIMQYFDHEAPPMASRNNLSAWGAYAVGEIGIAANEQRYKDWSASRARAMIASANPDGSLPLEMSRGKFAVHYQLHATAALTTSMANLCQNGMRFSANDMDGLSRVVRFSIEAARAPQSVSGIAGEAQRFDPVSAENKHAIAWIEAYGAMNREMTDKLDEMAMRPLSNSKLGGNLTDRYGALVLSCGVDAGV